MTKTAKIAISLSEDLLQEVEKEREATQETRSEFFRRAVEALLRRERERELEEQYVRGYLEMPETQEEIALADYTARLALAENPWESDDAQ